MIYSPDAEQQIDDLRRHYRESERPEAVRNLIAALTEAEARIERNPAAGLPGPRPYPSLAQPGRAWIKAGSYWIAYSTTSPPLSSASSTQRRIFRGGYDGRHDLDALRQAWKLRIAPS